MNESQGAQAGEWPRDGLLTRWERALRHEILLLVKAPRRSASCTLTGCWSPIRNQSTWLVCRRLLRSGQVQQINLIVDVKTGLSAVHADEGRKTLGLIGSAALREPQERAIRRRGAFDKPV